MSDQRCYLCGATAPPAALQLCIICERIMCQQDMPSDIYPGDSAICRECDKITPNREQAHTHFWLRYALKLEQAKKGST